jgi:hypothetical protein
MKLKLKIYKKIKFRKNYLSQKNISKIGEKGARLNVLGCACDGGD